MRQDRVITIKIRGAYHADPFDNSRYFRVSTEAFDFMSLYWEFIPSLLTSSSSEQYYYSKPSCTFRIIAS